MLKEQFIYWYRKYIPKKIRNTIQKIILTKQGWKWKVMDFEILINKYHLTSEGIAHIGAWKAKEVHKYKKLFGDIPIVFVEPNIKLKPFIEQNLKDYKKVRCEYLALGSTKTTGALNLHYSNIDEDYIGQSSSILDPLLHPPIGDKKVEVEIITADELFNNDIIDFLSIDVQGYELEVLKGATEILKGVKNIIIEVNKSEQYRGCPLIQEIDKYLSNYNFIRKETEWYGDTEDWGDAFYQKNSN